jgi:phytoene dehydrogenase-like protein
MTKATVVGSGPNGLAAAVTLARAGVDVTVLEAADHPGGGTRSGELTVPGLIHDHCSGIHPLAVDTAFSRSVDLAAHGLRWTWPNVQYSHPLDDGRGAAVRQDVDTTAGELGADAATWRAVFGPLSRNFPEVTDDFLRPMLHLPVHPLKLAHFGAFAGLPASVLGRLWRTPEARALFSGIAAHAFRPFHTLASSAVGVALGTAAHTFGWPAAVGGSAAISSAMVSVLESLGGRVETGVQVRSLAELSDSEVVMLDTSPRAAAQIAGEALHPSVARALTRYRHGPGAFVTHFAVDGGVPWQHTDSRHAGTVHVGGSFGEIATAEAQVHRGVMPRRPFILVAQQSVADTVRTRDGIQPVDAYAHVPAGYTGDATEAIIAQIERFAPGFRDRIVGQSVHSVRDVEEHNANYIDGDIITGANSLRQLLFRPRIALDPYHTGTAGIYLCSAATPPGAGAHGMCGYNAARSALAELGVTE